MVLQTLVERRWHQHAHSSLWQCWSVIQMLKLCAHGATPPASLTFAAGVVCCSHAADCLIRCYPTLGDLEPVVLDRARMGEEEVRPESMMNTSTLTPRRPPVRFHRQCCSASLNRREPLLRLSLLLMVLRPLAAVGSICCTSSTPTREPSNRWKSTASCCCQRFPGPASRSAYREGVMLIHGVLPSPDLRP